MPTLQTSRPRPLTLLGIVLLLAVLGVGAMKYFSGEVVEIRAAKVTHQDLISSVSTNGKVEPVEMYQAHSTFPGIIKQIYVEPNQKVKAGQLLVQMDDPFATTRITAATSSLRAAQLAAQDIQQNGSQEERLNFAADLSRAQQQQQQSATSLQAMRKLQQQGAASAAEVTAAEQHLSAADFNLKALQERSTKRYNDADRQRAQAQVADAQAALDAANRTYSNVFIRTPIPGTVYSLPISQYDYVPSGEDLMDVADLNRIRIRAYFDEPEIGSLSPGQRVGIVWDAKPNQLWHGHIETAPTTVITYGTRSVGECIITVDDANGDLLPNTNVTVTVTLSELHNVLSIPREALHIEGSNYFVYRVVGSKLVRTPVKQGLVNLTRAEILSGLSENDTVALSAISNRDLSNGLAVKIVE